MKVHDLFKSLFKPFSRSEFILVASCLGEAPHVSSCYAKRHVFALLLGLSIVTVLVKYKWRLHLSAFYMIFSANTKVLINHNPHL